MAALRMIDLTDARYRLSNRAPGYDARAPYRAAIANLEGDRVLELTTDEGESIRKLKLLVARAANEIDRPVGYGETPEGTLVVWLIESRPQRRRRRRQAEAESAPD